MCSFPPFSHSGNQSSGLCLSHLKTITKTHKGSGMILQCVGIILFVAVGIDVTGTYCTQAKKVRQTPTVQKATFTTKKF